MATTRDTPKVGRAGVVGAGTMGAGIAQALAQSGVDVQLVDLDDGVLKRAIEQIETDLRKGQERGRWTEEAAETARARVHVGGDIGALEAAQLVVEAVPERLELKVGVFAQLADVCADDAVLATNTSSLLVSAVAARTPGPERVLGLHFFNPAPRMRLVEVVPGMQTSDRTLALGKAAVEAMGKHPVVARDGIGFLVNRLARPFYGEALKLVQEGVATVEQVDRICRLGGGFRMGPLELIDLIGVDVNFEIARSFYDQSFGEPRWRPSPVQGRLVSAGHHGRKSGRGFYDYGDGPHRPADPEPREPTGGADRTVLVVGAGALAELLSDRARRAGFAVVEGHDPVPQGPWLTLDAGLDHTARQRDEGPRAVLCAGASLRHQATGGAAGFHLLPIADSRLVELTADDHTDPRATERATEFFAALGMAVEHVGDAPGLVLGRIVSQLVNEARFAVAEGVGTDEDVDAGTTLGLNYPHGSSAWRSILGDDYVRAVLDGLYRERHEERYRLAPALAA